MFFPPIVGRNASSIEIEYLQEYLVGEMIDGQSRRPLTQCVLTRELTCAKSISGSLQVTIGRTIAHQWASWCWRRRKPSAEAAEALKFHFSYIFARLMLLSCDLPSIFVSSYRLQLRSWKRLFEGVKHQHGFFGGVRRGFEFREVRPRHVSLSSEMSIMSLRSTRTRPYHSSFPHLQSTMPLNNPANANSNHLLFTNNVPLTIQCHRWGYPTSNLLIVTPTLPPSLACLFF
jgi:hypothetical protein